MGFKMNYINIESEISSILEKYQIKDEEVLRNTPKRVSKAFSELWGGLFNDIPKLAYFEAQKGMLIEVRDITFNSTCEHHLMPFYGTCKITLKSSGKTLGLSKFNRLVRHFSSKPTIQEKICKELYDLLLLALEPQYLRIEVDAKHTCVAHRGIKDACSNTKCVLEYVE